MGPEVTSSLAEIKRVAAYWRRGEADAVGRLQGGCGAAGEGAGEAEEATMGRARGLERLKGWCGFKGAVELTFSVVAR